MAKARRGKRIGFVDYELGNFHSNVYLQLLRGDLKRKGYAVAGCTAQKQRSGQRWAVANDVPWFESVPEMNDAVDHYIVLAPSNPEVHLELCRAVFPCGKPTYVDKTFAPDAKTAKQIFRLADRHAVPMQTTSALRYTEVQEYVATVGADHVKHMVAWGGGGSFGEYAIHPIELVISCMGPQVTGLLRRGRGDQSQLLLNFRGGRTAVINVYCNSNTPFAAAVTTKEETRLIEVDCGAIFRNTTLAMLELFAKQKPTIDPAETLAIMRIRDAAATAAARKKFVRI